MDQEVDPAEATRGLFLIVPPGLGSDTGALARVLETGQAVGVLLEASGADASAVRATCRSAGVALFATDPDDALRLDADGVLLAGASEVGAARRTLGDQRLIGARARVSRHEAMVAGEDGADFIAFGALDHAPNERLIEILAWWAEVFVLPSLALAGPLDEAAARQLADAGADFLGVPLDRVRADPGLAQDLARAFGTSRPG